MNVTSSVNNITNQIAGFAPAVIVAVQAAEAVPGASGSDKQKAVVQAVLTGVEVGSQALETHSNPAVASVALLVNLVVSVFNALGLFKRKQ